LLLHESNVLHNFVAYLPPELHITLRLLVGGLKAQFNFASTNLESTQSAFIWRTYIIGSFDGQIFPSAAMHYYGPLGRWLHGTRTHLPSQALSARRKAVW